MPPLPPDPDTDALLDAALMHVPFEGWSPVAFRAAVADTGMTPARARALCPRGAVDLAVAFHRRGDAAMVARLKEADLSDMRFRDKVAQAIRIRLEVVSDKEVVRRGSALFSLPHMAPEGAQLIWGTADLIWEALGDTSVDINWYTKRATLSAVYASVVLFWLGDDSLDGQATDDFIDRRIEDVMQFEKLKARMRDAAALKPLTGAIEKIFSGVRAPSRIRPSDLPGMWRPGGDA